MGRVIHRDTLGMIKLWGKPEVTTLIHPPRSTSILIADGSSLTVVGAQAILQRRADTHITTAANAHDLFQIFQTNRPDILILGDTLDPERETLTLVEQVTRIAPLTKIILMSLHAHGLFIRDAIHLGVSGYLSSLDDLREGLPTAVEFVLRDRLYLSPTANSEYLIIMHSGLQKWNLNAEARSVLHLLVQGHSVGSIATKMKTTSRHIYWVRDKLRTRFGAKTNEHLISCAKSEGFCAEVE